MKKFLIRTVIVIVAVFFLYQFTIGSEISNLKSTLASFSDKGKREMFKEKFTGIKIKSAPWRAGDVMHTLAETSLSASVLKFSSRISLREGLRKTWQWWEEAKSDGTI